MENGTQTQKFTKSFVKEDKVSVSKDKKKVIIHIGKMMISLNISYIKAILNNLENEQFNQEKAS